jgi:hypothetical protein
MNLEDLLVAIQNRNTEANAAVVNAVTALQKQLAEQTAYIQRGSAWRPVDSGGVSGGTVDFSPWLIANAPTPNDWVSRGRVGGDSPPGYKAVTMKLDGGIWFGSATKPLGVIARIRYAVENQVQNEVIVDVPAQGILSVPVCAGEVTVDFMVTQIAFTAVEMQETDGTNVSALASGIGWPNYPTPGRINPAIAGASAGAPVLKLGMSALDAIPRASITVPSRKITVHAASGDGAFPMYIPKGTQAFIVQGPSDATFNQQDQTGNFPTQRINAPITPNVVTQLMPGVQFIECSSSGGGYFSASFFLGT